MCRKLTLFERSIYTQSLSLHKIMGLAPSQVEKLNFVMGGG